MGLGFAFVYILKEYFALVVGDIGGVASFVTTHAYKKPRLLFPHKSYATSLFSLFSRII